jgi:hypothetical protein
MDFPNKPEAEENWNNDMLTPLSTVSFSCRCVSIECVVGLKDFTISSQTDTRFFASCFFGIAGM